MSAGEPVQLIKPRRHVVSVIPSKAVERQTLKPVLKFSVASESVGLNDIINQKQSKTANTTVDKKPMSNNEHKSKSRSTDKYAFQSETKDVSASSTLADSLVFLLCNLESVTELASGEDTIEMLQEGSNSQAFIDFLTAARAYSTSKNGSIDKLLPLLTSVNPQDKMKELLGILSGSFQTSILQDYDPYSGSVGELAATFAEEAKSNGFNKESAPLSHLLLGLLSIDLGLQSDQQQEAASTPSSQIIEKINSAGFDCRFARQLVRLVLRDVHADLLPGNGDDVADGIVEKFTSLLLKKLNSQSENLSKDIGQETQIPLVQSSFNRFDFTNNFSIGLFELGLALNRCITRRNFHFILPNGKRITHKSQNSLTAVNIPVLRGNGNTTEDLAYPTVLDAVNQIQSKETFATSDFDWICLNYNITQNQLEWLAKDQSLSSSSQEHSKSSYFVGFSHSQNITLESLKESIIVPLSNRQARYMGTTRMDNLNLFVGRSADATIDELLKYLNTVLREQILISEDVSLADIKFESLNGPQFAQPTEGSQKVKDLMLQVGWTQKVHENQVCPFVCSYRIRHALPDSEAKSAHLIIEENRVLSTQMLKTSLTSFLQLIFKEIANDSLCRVSDSCILAGQPLEYWLPTLLIVDVHKFAASVVDSKSNLDVKELATLVQEAGLTFNAKYMLKGLILSKSDANEDIYYPATVDHIKMTAMQYFNDSRGMKLSAVKDSDIRYAVFERSTVDIESE